jgi:hypothetical protein
VFHIILTIAIAVCSEDVFIRRRLGHFIIFALVTSAIVAMYIMLNRYRTGEIFFSIVGLKNWLHPISDMARHGYAQPFIGDDLVSVAAQETLRGDYGYEAQIRLVRRLRELCQCTPTQEQSLLFTKYLLVICNNPTAYLRVILTNFSSLQSIVADPVWTINSFIQLGTPIGRVVPGLSLKNIAMLVQDFSLTKFALLVLAAISTAVSAIAFWLFIFGIPMRVICEWRTGKRMNDTLAVTSFLWLLFVSLATSYSLVHVEPRYVLPALPAALVGVVYTLQWLRGAPPISSALGQSATYAGHALTSEKGPGPDIKPRRVNVAEVPKSGNGASANARTMRRWWTVHLGSATRLHAAFRSP